ncbi:OmpH family outer membrane protein [Zunongwangia sp. HGR-M22]|uniref:OmpH family outer membrane protein n=1 Tax=Zunongwangia sp. HGR-M22 TaxID=3015168 RepID=UPI0022DD0F26|nr:OmpH family outer membrane protein [Zunongwangia sp. HGR-M22]WBL26061.1 OmpH family outer membrane protein [Zunongwangia sp. HGR-M22]
MKKIFLIILTILLPLGAFSQRGLNIGYIDMDYILENIPEYQEASNQLDNRVQDWKNEIDTKKRAISEIQTQLENERTLLTKELLEEREDDIKYLQDQLTEYQQKRFGPGGDYILQKRQLIKPIQDQVFNAVQEIAERRKFDFIFDRTSDIGMIYAKSNYDMSDQVVRIITRAANREEIESRQDLIELQQAENRTVEQDSVIQAREQASQNAKTERELYIEERRRKRDSMRAAKKAEFEERRAQILKDRERRRDSINAAREAEVRTKDTIN